MTSFSVAQDTAAQQPTATWFAAIEILFPSFALHLLDGAGTMTLFGNNYVGSDLTYGALAAGDKFSDGVSDTSPTPKMTLLAPNNVSMAGLSAATVQGSQVSHWIGIVKPVTGLPVSDPDLRFIGSVDVPTINIDKNLKTLDLQCVSAFEQFFYDDGGVRLSDAWYRQVWPGELGLQFATAVQIAMPWGSDAPLTDTSKVQSSLTLSSAVQSALTASGYLYCLSKRAWPPRKRRSITSRMAPSNGAQPTAQSSAPFSFAGSASRRRSDLSETTKPLSAP